jgi:hypothetical protein
MQDFSPERRRGWRRNAGHEESLSAAEVADDASYAASQEMDPSWDEQAVPADMPDTDKAAEIINGEIVTDEERMAHDALPSSATSYWQAIGQRVRKVAPELLEVIAEAASGERGFESTDQEAGGRPSESTPDAPDDRVGYDRAAAAEADYELVREAIAEVRAQMRAITQELDRIQDAQWAQARQVDTQLARLAEITGSVLAAGPGQDPGVGLAATQLASVTRQEVKSGRAQFGGRTMGGGGGPWDAAWAWMKRLSRRLWSMLSNLLHVTEWSVTGQVGTGPFGLASASISVTFGTPPEGKLPDSASLARSGRAGLRQGEVTLA